MKQYRITSEHVLQDSDTDAYLSPDDPIHELKIAHYLNGLGSAQRLAEYRTKQANAQRDIIKNGINNTLWKNFKN